jgi:hypothetical protein
MRAPFAEPHGKRGAGRRRIDLDESAGGHKLLLLH